MTPLDPYAILKVAREADAAAIKAAYRRSVRIAHPDRGGDAEDFMAIVQAFAVLSDPMARRLFDETGQIDEDGVRDYRQEVAVVLADMFDAAVTSAFGLSLPLHSVNFIEQMTTVVRAQIADAQEKRLKADGEIKALQGLKDRIKRRDGAANLFVERLDEQIKGKVQAHRVSLHRLSLLETAALELANYDSEVELFSALDVA
jgi:curved DNA-binding protein CbpA